MSAVNITEIWVAKQQLANSKIVQSSLDPQTLGADEVLLQVSAFGFSANNITYAAMGEQMRYWDFFPADEGWGKVPVWGYADVVASQHPQISEGQRFFGYFPMASHLKVTAANVTDYGFRDASPWRKSNAPVYDNYLNTARDPAYKSDLEVWDMNFRPLFMTSFMLDDYLQESLTDSVDTLLFSSASSKTAFGAALLMHQQRAQRGSNARLVGLTSAGNREFVQQLGCYDEVVSYDGLAQLKPANSAWLLDFAGNQQLVQEVNQSMGDTLTRIVQVGAADWQAQAKAPIKSIHPGQSADFFFAPHQIKKRTQDWGPAGLNQNYAKAWQQVLAPLQELLQVQTHQGVEQIEGLYQQFLRGEVDAKAIHVLNF